MNEIKRSTLFRSAEGQAVKVPPGFELPGTEVTVTKDGERLIVEPARATHTPMTWAEFLDTIDPVDVEWPDVDEGLLPVETVNLLK